MPYYDPPFPTSDYTRCPHYPCRDPYCAYEPCQLHQYEREHMYQPIHRRQYHPYPHYYTPSEALKQHREAKDRAYHLAHTIIDQERRAEKEKLEKEATQKVEDIERGKAEREKDAERGKKARERQPELKKGASRRAYVSSDSETDSELEDDRVGRCFLRHLKRENERHERERERGRSGKYLEKRWDGKGKPYVSVVSRQRVPSWVSCFCD